MIRYAFNARPVYAENKARHSNSLVPIGAYHFFPVLDILSQNMQYTCLQGFILLR